MTQSRKLAVIMFTDIVGYTTLMGNNELQAFELLKKNREIQKLIIDAWVYRINERQINFLSLTGGRILNI